MDRIEGMAALLALAFLRYVPAVVLPGFSPLRWAPVLVRIVFALALAWMTVLAMPDEALSLDVGVTGLIAAAMGEIAIGMVFGLAVMIPQAALHTSGWLIDIQAGLGAATLFNPGADNDPQSLLGTALMLLATVLFFTLDMHLELYRGLVASAQLLPIGGLGVRPDPEGFFGLLGSSFLLGVMVVLPVLLGLFAIDVGVAYATRSMPQANVFFLALPLKVLAAILILVVSLRYAPALILRLYQDAFARVPAMLGG
ncbi:MAG: flagellar biosynthetic protein FliR [Pseudomonadota bacterium]